MGAAFPCIYLEIDTFKNVNLNDPSANQLSIQYGGSPTSYNFGSLAQSIGNIVPAFSLSQDNQQITLQLQYDHDAGVFSVFRLQGSIQQLLFHTEPGYFIENMLNLDQGSLAWVGFTSASGQVYAATYVHNFQFTPLQTLSAGVQIICPHDLRVTADTLTCTWNRSTGTPTLINLWPDTTVSYKKQSRGPYPVGTYGITYVASNSDGYLTVSCTQNLIVMASSSCPAITMTPS